LVLGLVFGSVDDSGKKTVDKLEERLEDLKVVLTAFLMEYLTDVK